MSYQSERDIEIPRLIDFLDRHSDEIETVLDVGCYGSKYLEEIKKRGKHIDGIDFTEGEKEKEILENYFIGDFLEKDLSRYDLVICLSTIEHYGVKQRPDPDHTGLQLFLFEKLVLTAEKFLFVTFPYGLPAIHENELSIISQFWLDRFLGVLGDVKYKLSFYYNDNPQSGSGWLEISKNEADKKQYNPNRGVQCVCILEVEK